MIIFSEKLDSPIPKKVLDLLQRKYPDHNFLIEYKYNLGKKRLLCRRRENEPYERGSANSIYYFAQGARAAYKEEILK